MLCCLQFAARNLSLPPSAQVADKAEQIHGFPLLI